jgi:4-cresol dehydrogenase (hydroxylating) flavoprotein subunit
LYSVMMILYDKQSEEHRVRANRLCETLVVEAAKLGFGEYRAHLAYMDLIGEQYGYNDHALRRFVGTLKDAADPNGILSPGKQGIWPRGMRR